MIKIFATNTKGRKHQEISRQLLEKVVSSIYPQLSEYTIVKNENGKPHIPELPGFHFNISHSVDWVVLAVSNTKVGIDIEKIKNVNYGIVKRFFTQREKEFLDGANDKVVNKLIIRMWTMKEARSKLTGEGLCGNLSTLETLNFDHTWASMVDGQYVRTFSFGEDRDYILTLASTEEIQKDPKITIIK